MHGTQFHRFPKRSVAELQLLEFKRYNKTTETITVIKQQELELKKELMVVVK